MLAPSVVPAAADPAFDHAFALIAVLADPKGYSEKLAALRQAASDAATLSAAAQDASNRAAVREKEADEALLAATNSNDAAEALQKDLAKRVEDAKALRESLDRREMAMEERERESAATILAAQAALVADQTAAADARGQASAKLTEREQAASAAADRAGKMMHDALALQEEYEGKLAAMKQLVTA